MSGVRCSRAFHLRVVPGLTLKGGKWDAGRKETQKLYKEAFIT